MVSNVYASCSFKGFKVASLCLGGETPHRRPQPRNKLAAPAPCHQPLTHALIKAPNSTALGRLYQTMRLHTARLVAGRSLMQSGLGGSRAPRAPAQ